MLLRATVHRPVKPGCCAAEDGDMRHASAPLSIRQQIGPLLRRYAPAMLLVLFYLYCLASPAIGQEFAKADPIRIEAAILRNFARYVTWPHHAFKDTHLAWRICILGDDPFGQVLEKTFEGRTEQGRSFQVFRAETLEELPPCQIVFIAYQDAAKRRAVLELLKKQPVLTVSAAPDFLQEGGIIRFKVTDRVEMSVNLDQARSSSLKIQTKMLEVSREVLENGIVRRLR